jgi:hypothetical protein
MDHFPFSEYHTRSFSQEVIFQPKNYFPCSEYTVIEPHPEPAESSPTHTSYLKYV